MIHPSYIAYVCVRWRGRGSLCLCLSRAVGARTLPRRDLLLPCVLCLVGFSLGVHSQTPEAFADGTSMGVMASLLTAAYTRLLARAGE